MKFVEYGIELSSDEARKLLPLVRKKAVQLKRALFDKELAELHAAWKADQGA